MPVILAHGVREGPLVAFVETGGKPAAVPVIAEVVKTPGGDMCINSWLDHPQPHAGQQ